MPVAVEEKKTLADFRALPEGTLCQLIEGELVMTPSPIYYHQHISIRLASELLRFVEQRGLGTVVTAPMDVHLTETEAYQPDILFISNERAGIIEERIEGAPDLVVEVLSPSTGYAPNESEEVLLGCYDLTHKRRVYQEAGVEEYWIVDPMEKTVDVLRNAGEAFETHDAARVEGTVASRLLEGFSVELNDLFPARTSEE